MAKLHDLLTWLAIDRASVILGVVVVHNEEGVFQLRGALTRWYWPFRVLLDSSGKVLVNGLGFTDAEFDPYPYHILTSMGGLKKHEN